MATTSGLLSCVVAPAQPLCDRQHHSQHEYGLSPTVFSETKLLFLVYISCQLNPAVLQPSSTTSRNTITTFDRTLLTKPASLCKPVQTLIRGRVLMRLLRIEANGEFSLIEREGRNIPRYAILSHTWGKDEEEVTFKDLTNRTGQTKIGYRKLRFCAKQATQDALNYFWVDTCCIDKSSSADLSEAINSMFRWYQNADKCYVYLSDVSVSASDSKEQLLSASRWLTRGWTLQELLASQSVNFFSSEGCLLGSKSSLIQELAATTGIPVEALLGESLSHFSVQERLSWAERRDTKREEDAAYCLLGIFGIQIPPMYGEGRQNAMRRLLKEIKSGIGLDDILKWLDPPEFATVYHESIVEREGNTGQWIFGHPFFRDWLQKESVDKTLGRIRWIHG